MLFGKFARLRLYTTELGVALFGKRCDAFLVVSTRDSLVHHALDRIFPQVRFTPCKRFEDHVRAFDRKRGRCAECRVSWQDWRGDTLCGLREKTSPPLGRPGEGGRYQHHHQFPCYRQGTGNRL